MTIESFNHTTTKDLIMTNRIDYAKASPEGYKAFGAVYASLQKCGLPQGTGRSGVPAGVADQRLRLLHRHAFPRPAQGRPGRRKAGAGAGVARRRRRIQPRERAALAWAETVTRVAETGVPDADYEAAAAEFSDKELADLTYAIGLMNAFNRFGIRVPHRARRRCQGLMRARQRRISCTYPVRPQRRAIKNGSIWHGYCSASPASSKSRSPSA